MRRLLLAQWGLLLGSGAAFAQFPQQPQYPGPSAPGVYTPGAPVQPSGTYTPGSPSQLPPLRPMYPGVTTPGSPMQTPPPGVYTPGSPVAQSQEIPLPKPENKFTLNAADVSLKRISGGWQLWAGQKLLRDFGDRENDARDALRVYRDLRPTEWVTIGGPKPVVEYGLLNGRPALAAGAPGTEEPKGPSGGSNGASGTNALAPSTSSGPLVTGAGAKLIIPIDLRTVRVEPVRGVWCVRDDDNILFNFGPSKGDAEQTLAVVRRYGFNRVGIVGQPAPVMTYLFAAPEAGLPPPQKGPLAKAALQAQIDGLSRVGIPVAGVGFVGEMVHFDPRKLEVRKDGADWVVAAGTEVIGRYGPSEWIARDAARTMADSRFTEFCKLGSAGLTFFLVNGQAPNRVPFTVQGRRFDLNALKVQQYGERWAVTENGRHLLDCATAEEGDILVRVLKHYQFDQLCHLGPTPKLGVSFLAKGK